MEVLIAISILSFAIIPIVNIMLYFESGSKQGVFSSFAFSYAKTMLSNLKTKTSKDLEKWLFKEDREITIEDKTLYKEAGNIFLDFGPIKYKNVIFHQSLYAEKIRPTYFFSEESGKISRKARGKLYFFRYKVYWKITQKQEALKFEFFKAFY